jgi:hypothetical protein
VRIHQRPPLLAAAEPFTTDQSLMQPRGYQAGRVIRHTNKDDGAAEAILQ